jgi:spermidine synthase
MMHSEGNLSRSARVSFEQAGPLLAVGASSLIWQVASARAIMSGLYGNELTLGLVLGSWLVLISLATALSARFKSCRRHPRPLLILTMSLVPVGVLVSAVIQHQALPAFSTVGLVVGPGRALLSTVACLAPACLLLGAGFGLVSLQVPAGLSAGRWAARVYLLESAGMVAAGLLFHLLMARVSFRSLALVAGAPPLVVAVLLIFRPHLERRWRWLAGCGALVGLVSLAYLVPGLPLPGSRLISPSLPGYQLLDRQNSRHAALSVLRREDQILFLANGLTVFSNQDDRLVEGDLHLSLLAHPAPRRVLMIGGGLGGGLREALKHPVESIDYLELDQELVRLARKWAPRLTTPLDDRRVRLIFGDGRQLVASRQQHYDLILVGLPGPDSALINRFFTEEFFTLARRALRPGGIVSVSLDGSETYLGDEMAQVHSSVRAAMRRACGNVSTLPGQRTLVFAGRGGAVDLGPATIGGRYRERKLATRLFGQSELLDRTQELKQELYLERLSSVLPLRNVDLHPAVYFHASLQWLARSLPSLSRALSSLAKSAEGKVWLFPLGALVLALLWGLLRRRKVAAGFAIGTAGLAGMAIELCLLLASQEIRGVIYHEIGALLTAFMLGLAAGAVVGRRVLAVWPRQALRITVAACALVAFVGVVVLHLARDIPGLALVLFLGLMLLLGTTVGACYAPAADALAARHGPSAAARAYAWDLVGAAVGAIAATFALPVLGLPVTCICCGSLCLGSALSLRSG